MESPGLPRRTGLDGLRAVAVLGVLLYHGGVTWTPGGFLGVDLFFVLSGFLITSLLLHQVDVRGKVDLAGFWLARARRLLPALGAVLVVVLWLLPLAGVTWGQRVRGDAVATLFYVSNWWFVATGESYVDQASGPSPLLHTWSLAIEEQWYVLFPLLLLGLFSWRYGRRALPWVLGVLLGWSVLTMTVRYDASADVSRVYFGTDTRLQALLVGALTAALWRRQVWREGPAEGRPPVSDRLLEVVPVVGLAALLGTMAWVHPETGWMYRGGYLLVAVAAMLAVLGATMLRSDGTATGLARVLSWRPAVLLGLISYGVYLWHWPVYVVLDSARTGLVGVPLLLLRLGVTLAVSVASYLLVERPVRRGVRGGVPARLLLPALAGAGAIVLLAVVVGPLRAAPAQADSMEALATVAAGLRSAAPTPPPGAGATALPLPTTGPAPFPSSWSPPPSSPTSPAPRPSAGAPHVVLVGDSQALSLYAAVKDQPGLGVTVDLATRLGCGVVPFESAIDGMHVSPQQPLCGEWEKARASEIAAKAPDLGVLFAGGWEQYDRWIDGAAVPFASPQWAQATQADYERVLKEILAAAPRAAVVLDHCHGAPPVDLPAATVYQWGRYAPVVNDPARIAAVNDAARAAAASFGGSVTVVDTNAFLCPAGFTPTKDGVTLRTDGLHWTTDGARLVWQWLRPQLVAAAKG